jgi:putative hydrolase of the HAD superfamily
MQSWNQSLIEVGIENPQFAGELSQHFQKERRNLHVVYPDVISILNMFKQSFKLGLITNGAPGVQNEKLDKSKLRSFFNVIVISGEFMTKKPDPVIFEEILKLLDNTPSEVLMIGNSLNSDIQGGNIAGITTLWLNRDRKKNDTNTIPDFEIGSLYEIRDILEILR